MNSSIEKYKSIFLKIGVLISMLIVLFILEWSTPSQKNGIDKGFNVDIDLEVIPIQKIRITKRIPPKPIVRSSLEIVNDIIETNNENTPEIYDVESIDEIEIPKLKEEEVVEEIVLANYTMPEFPGGIENLKRYIKRNTVYPVEARENQIQGRVYTRFLITKKGKVDSVFVLKQIHPLLDKEAIRIISSLPDWQPYMQNGVAIDYWYTVPVTFVLQ